MTPERITALKTAAETPGSAVVAIPATELRELLALAHPQNAQTNNEAADADE